MKNVIDTDLTGKVAVVTGASGTLCSIFAMALARAGAKVALLGRNLAKLNEVADKIAAEGGIAKGYACNVLSKDNCFAVADQVQADLGPCDILINGAGGNNARANTDKEFFEMGDLESDTSTTFLARCCNDAPRTMLAILPAASNHSGFFFMPAASCRTIAVTKSSKSMPFCMASVV